MNLPQAGGCDLGRARKTLASFCESPAVSKSKNSETAGIIRQNLTHRLAVSPGNSTLLVAEVGGPFTVTLEVS